jgi:NhaP-type Na+/H+ or K+/H+ antiporter
MCSAAKRLIQEQCGQHGKLLPLLQMLLLTLLCLVLRFMRVWMGLRLDPKSSWYPPRKLTATWPALLLQLSQVKVALR